MQEKIGAITKVIVEKIYLGIDKINYGSICKRIYHVRYSTGITRTYSTPPETVQRFIEENKIDYHLVSYAFKDESEVQNDNGA